MDTPTIQFVNQMLLTTLSDNQADPQVKAEMTNLLISLQKTIVQQQTLVKILLLQQQNLKLQQSPLFKQESARMLIKGEESSVQQKSPTGNHRLQELLSQSLTNSAVKQEHNEDLKKGLGYAKKDGYANMVAKRFSSLETAASPGNLSQKSISRLESSILSEKSPSDEEEGDHRQDSGIIRQNGFKTKSEVSDLEQDSALEKHHRKCNKLIVPKRPPSKAKHLWINYGRKIIEFAMNNTQDEVQERVKQLVGKLSSKKDFEDVFGLKSGDNDFDKLFKTMLGKLALFFIKTQADAAFEGSKYREQMITQKSIVAIWISKLVSEQI